MFSRNTLDEIFSKRDYKPEYLVDLLEKNFADEYASRVGVRGDKFLTLKQHTLMVSGQFEKYFANRELPANIDKNFFRLFLALHDIGKPKAMKQGGRHLQRDYNINILKSTLAELHFSEQEIKVATALLSGDPIGRYLQMGDADRSAYQIEKMSKESGIRLDQFFELLLIYYCVDAGSYTTDAGDSGVLDDLFEFDAENNKLKFSASTAEKINKLQELLIQEYSNG